MVVADADADAGDAAAAVAVVDTDDSVADDLVYDMLVCDRQATGRAWGSDFERMKPLCFVCGEYAIGERVVSLRCEGKGSAQLRGLRVQSM